jgi:glycine betaine transporter
MLDAMPIVGSVLMVVATVLVATYYITSLDAGTYALADFVSAPKPSGARFRVVLVFSIASVTTVLLTLGGTAVVDTVQTGTIIGGAPVLDRDPADDRQYDPAAAQAGQRDQGPGEDRE